MDPTSAAIEASYDWPSLVGQLGFGSVIFVAFMFLLKWVLKQQEIILDNSKEERQTNLVVMQGYQKTLEQMNIQSNEFHKQVTEAHGYQRSEHDKMIESLTNVCSLTQQNSNCLEKVKDSLDEQGKILVRINGFKHD